MAQRFLLRGRVFFKDLLRGPCKRLEVPYLEYYIL